MTGSASHQEALARRGGLRVRPRDEAAAALRARRARRSTPRSACLRCRKRVGADATARAGLTPWLLASWERAFAAAERAFLAAAADGVIAPIELRALQHGLQEERRRLARLVAAGV